MTVEQAEALQPGTKVIFTKFGGGLHWQTGNVFTFAGLYPSNDSGNWGRLLQFQELLNPGNDEHCAYHEDLEIFDPAIHREFRIMDALQISINVSKFHEKYG